MEDCLRADDEFKDDASSVDGSVVEWVERGDDEGVDDDRISLGLIGNVWTNNNSNPVAFISMMKGIWSVKNGVDIVKIGRNL